MSSNTQTLQKSAGSTRLRRMTMTGMLSGIGFILMFLEFSVPVMPGFIKMDFSELPALIAAFAMGPASGAAVCLVKNLLHLTVTNTGGVGEISNFILGVCFVIPAGLIYRQMKNKKGAFLGSLAGAAIMAVVSVFSNYYFVYPVYTAFMPMETIMAAYKLLNANVETLWDALIWFNMPFTFFKGMCSVIITFLIYKHISRLIKGAMD